MTLAPAEIAVGPMLIGFTFNAILLGVMLTQVYIYYTSFKKDSKWIKLYVAILLVLDLANTVTEAIAIYQEVIVNFDNLESLNFVRPVLMSQSAVTACIASAVQFFYAWRIYNLTKSNTFPVLIILNGIVGFVASLVTSVEIGESLLFSGLAKDKPSITVWLASEVVGDILITIVLVTYLTTHRTGFKKSDMLIDKIIRITIQTGILTATFATVNLVVYLADPTGLHLLFNFVLAKLYSNTLMSTLNSRGIWMSDGPGASLKSSNTVSSRTQDDVPMNIYKSSNSKPSEMIDFNKRTEVFVSVESDDNGGMPQDPRRGLEEGGHSYGDMKGSYP
ncbi:hypothetical protein CPC08DRAFT_675445 [Agrocybe pediades]|nr:hypothetical protein CPC08DRAFT_675445 [Agrocybe pediades]